jgi:hypothetical protein
VSCCSAFLCFVLHTPSRLKVILKSGQPDDRQSQDDEEACYGSCFTMYFHLCCLLLYKRWYEGLKLWMFVEQDVCFCINFGMMPGLKTRDP